MAIADSTSTIRSLADLAQARTQALAHRQAEGEVCILRVSTATCGLAAGALETLHAFQHLAQETRRVNLRVEETGCLGLCALEPVVAVHLPGRPPVLYGHVTPAVARQIVDEHILGGKMISEHYIADPF